MSKTLLTPEQYRKGWDFTLRPSDFRLPDGSLDEDAFVEAQTHFSSLNIETYMTVRTRFGAVVPMKINKAQKLFLRTKHEQLEKYGYFRISALKVRQCGSSTINAKDILPDAKFRNFQCSVIAHMKEGTAERTLFNYVLDGYNDWVRHEENGALPKGFTDVERLTKSYIKFKSGGTIQTVRADPSAVGTTNQRIWVSEASRIQGWGDFWESISPSLPKGNNTGCVIESTARYTGPYFFEKWKENWEYEQDTGEIPVHRSIFIPCHLVEEYCEHPLPDGYDWDKFWEERDYMKSKGFDIDELWGPEELLVKKKWHDYYDKVDRLLPLNFWKWRRETINEQDAEPGSGFTKLQWFQQNYPMTPEEAELVAGDTVFPRSKLQERKLMVEKPTFRGDISYNVETKEPELKSRPHKAFYVEWDDPIPNLTYVAMLDTANEREGDFWCLSVYSPAQEMMVARLRANSMSTHDILCRCIPICYRWNNALFGWESNMVGIGDTILLKMLARDVINPPGTPYTNLYIRRRMDEHRFKKIQRDARYGFQMSNNKLTLINLWMDALYNPNFKIYDEELLNEMWFMRQLYDKEGEARKTPGAPKGKHDDIIISGGMAMFVARELPERGDLLSKQRHGKMESDKSAFAKYEDNIKKHLAQEMKRKFNKNFSGGRKK